MSDAPQSRAANFPRPLVPIGDLGEVTLGLQKSPSRSATGTPYPYIRAANIVGDSIDFTQVQYINVADEEVESNLLKPGDLLISEASGSPDQVGRVAVWEGQLESCVYQNTVIRFRPTSITTEYAYRLVQYLRLSGLLAQVSRGVGILHLGLTRFRRLLVPAPPTAEQEEVSDFLDHQLSTLRRAQTLLADSLQLAFKRETKLLEIAANGDLQTERDYDGSDRRAGWREVRVDEAGSVDLGLQRSPRSHFGDHMRPYLRVANVLDNAIDTSDVAEMNFTPSEFEHYALRAGDILLNEGQSPELVGRAAIFDNEVAGAAFQKTLLRFRAGPQTHPYFALIVFRHYQRSGEFARRSRGSTNIVHLTRKRFISMPFPLPDFVEQEVIATEVRRTLARYSRQQSLIDDALRAASSKEAKLYSQIFEEFDIVSANRPQANPARSSPAEPSPREQKPGMTRSWRAPKSGVTPAHQNLEEVLRQSNRPVPLPELMARAGYDRDSVDEIEAFYLALRSTESEGAIESQGDRENSEVNLRPEDAPR